MSKKLTALMILVLIGTSSQAGADNFDLIPYVGVRGEYTDNLFFDTEENEAAEDFITTISPGLDIVERTEKLLLGLYGRLGILFYDDNDDLDTVDQFYDGEIAYQFTERFDAYAGGGYLKDSRPDRDIEATGLILNTSKREQYRASAGAGLVLTEKSNVGLSYRYRQDEWDDENLVDSRVNSAGLSYGYHLGTYLPRTVFQIYLSYADYDYDTSKNDVYGGTIGLSWDYSETLNAALNLGARYVVSKFEVLELVPTGIPLLFEIATVTETTENWGGVGNLTFTHTGERSSVSLTAGQDVDQRSGSEGVVLRTSGIFNYRYRFTQEFSCSFYTSYFYNQADAGETSRDDIRDQTLNIGPGLRYDFTRDLYLAVGYRYTWFDDIEDDVTRERNKVFATLRFQYPIFD